MESILYKFWRIKQVNIHKVNNIHFYQAVVWWMFNNIGYPHPKYEKHIIFVSTSKFWPNKKVYKKLAQHLGNDILVTKCCNLW